jgi:hypothetical protein
MFGVRASSDGVVIEGDHLVATFGPWRVDTPLANVTGARVTGPYSWWKVVGPPRYSVADRSLTFATRTDVGLEITFATPVTGLDPLGKLRHPSLTVTVADVEGLRRALRPQLPPTGS